MAGAGMGLGMAIDMAAVPGPRTGTGMTIVGGDKTDCECFIVAASASPPLPLEVSDGKGADLYGTRVRGLPMMVLARRHTLFGGRNSQCQHCQISVIPGR